MTSPIMTEAANTTWYEANQGYLAAGFSRLRSYLEDFLLNHEEVKACDPTPQRERENTTESAAWSFSQPPALEQLCSSFELSSFERDVLLLCAGAEMDTNLAELLASIGNNRCPLPTFSLALTALHDAHWSALSPARALRY